MKKNIISALLAIVACCIFAVATFSQESAENSGKTVGGVDIKDTSISTTVPLTTSAEIVEPRPSFEQKPGPEQVDETKVYDSSYKACVEKGIPIDTDEYLALLLGLANVKSPDVSQGLTGYLVCRQYVNRGKETGGATGYITEPYFKKGVGESGLKLTAEQLKNGEEKIKDMLQAKLQDLFVLYVMMGEKEFLGKPLAVGGCGMLPEKRRAGCEKNVNLVMSAVAAGDEAACSTVDEKDLPGGSDMCTLMVSKDSTLCRIKGFMYPLPYELCQDFATMSIALSGKVTEPDKLQLVSDNYFFKAILQEIKSKDKCKTYFEENVLTGYCEWKGNADVKGAIAKYLEESKKVSAENEKLKKEAEEKFKKDQEEALKKEKEEKLKKEQEEALKKEQEEALKKEQEEKLKKEQEEKLKKEQEEKTEEKVEDTE